MDQYKEIDDIPKKYALFKSVSFNEVYQFSFKERSKKERITPNENEVSDCLNSLTEEPTIAFFAASKLVEYIFNAPSILYDMSEEQFLPIFGMLQEIVFQRTGLTLLSMAFEACDLIPSFHVFIENNIFDILKDILQRTSELETYWNILNCISCASKSSINEIQEALLNSGIVDVLLELELEGEEFQKRKMKTINSLVIANWNVDFEPVSFFYNFIISMFLSDNDFDVFYGVLLLKNGLKTNPGAITTFIESDENKERLSLCLENERTELRENAIEILSTICSQEKSIVEQFVDMNIINHIFNLIDASPDDHIQEYFNILLVIFNSISPELQEIVIQKTTNFFENSNIIDFNSDSKLMFLKLIDEIAQNAAPHLIDGLITEQISEFLESMIETETDDNVFLVCRIFLTLYVKFASIKSEVPEQQTLSNNSLDIIRNSEKNLNHDENSEDIQKIQIINQLLSYYDQKN